MVADPVIYHPVVSHYIKYAGTMVGREKILRVIQYFSRFLGWYLKRSNASKATIDQVASVKSQLSVMRRVLRAGKNVEHFRAAAAAADVKTMDPLLRYAALGRQIGYAGYMTCDTANIPSALGLVRNSKYASWVENEANRFWIAAIAFSIAAQVYTLHGLGQKEKKLDKKNGEGAVEAKKIAAERLETQMQLAMDVLDSTIPMKSLQWLGLDDGLVGLAGTMSSVIGVYTQWKKTA